VFHHASLSPGNKPFNPSSPHLPCMVGLGGEFGGVCCSFVGVGSCGVGFLVSYTPSITLMSYL